MTLAPPFPSDDRMQYGRLGEPERVSVRLGLHVGVKSQKTASWLLTGIKTTPHRAGQAELHHRGATQVRGLRS